MSIVPDFFVIGAPKAGTTSIWDLLRQHPQIRMCDPKEPGFFCFDDRYARGSRWYDRQFPSKPEATVVGDVTPGYSRVVSYPETPSRIASHAAQAKIIYVVRHPIQLIESAFRQMLHSKHPMPQDLNRAVHEYYPLLEIALYWQCISAYREYFSDNQIKVVLFEEFRKDPPLVLADICRFIGVSEDFDPTDAQRPRNAASDLGLLPPYLAAARKLPGFMLFVRLLPKSWRTAVYERVKRPLPKHFTWDDESLAHVLANVRPDTEKTLSYAGCDPDYWKLSSSIPELSDTSRNT